MPDDFVLTTNISLKKPAIGSSDDKWGEYINSSFDVIDSEVHTLKSATTDRTLESLSNVLNVTPTTGQVLQYSSATWTATTLSIPENIQDLTNVTITSPSSGQVLEYNGSAWVNSSLGASTITDGSITSAKLDTSLRGQINLILQTTGSPTDNQILRYDSANSVFQFEDLPGGTFGGLSDTDTTSVTTGHGIIYNSSGKFQARALAISDITNLQTELDSKTTATGVTIGDKGDIVVSNVGNTWTIDTGVVTYAKIQDVSTTDRILGRSTSGAGSVEEIPCTSAGRALLDDADAAAQRTTLGLGTIATQAANAVDVDGGSVDGVTIGTTTAVTDLRVDNLQLDGNTISSTNTDGGILLTPNGTGNISLGNFIFNADQTVGSSEDNYVLTYDHSTTSIGLEVSTGGSGITAGKSIALAMIFG